MRPPIKFLGFLSLVAGRLLFAEAADPPPWLSQPSRTVDSGYIVYIGGAEDASADTARFKAEGAALADLANECSFIPKGARIEDHYQEKSPNGFHAFAKVGINFEACEEAQKTADPEQIRFLANAEMTAQLKRYHDLIDAQQSQPAEVADFGAPQPDGTVVFPRPWGTTPPPRWVHNVVVTSPWHYFVIREQILYAKSYVILAPQTAFPTGSAQTTQFTKAIVGANNQIHTYARANPVVRLSSTTWSNVRSDPGLTQARSETKTPPAPGAAHAASPSPLSAGRIPPRQHTHAAHARPHPRANRHAASASKPKPSRVPPHHKPGKKHHRGKHEAASDADDSLS